MFRRIFKMDKIIEENVSAMGKRKETYQEAMECEVYKMFEFHKTNHNIDKIRVSEKEIGMMYSGLTNIHECSREKIESFVRFCRKKAAEETPKQPIRVDTPTAPKKRLSKLKFDMDPKKLKY